MNKKLIAPIAVVAVIGLKQFFNVEITEGQVEEILTFTITVTITVGSAIWAAVMEPKKVDQ